MLVTCNRGHQFHRSADCRVCPECAKDDKPDFGFLSLLAAPARRALQREGLVTLHALSARTELEILKLHGVGKSTIPKLRKALEDVCLSFRR